MDGTRWRTRTGAPWRDVPERYGPCDRVHGLFRRWQRNGTWARIVTRLRAEADAKGLTTWEVHVDSTACRAHQHATGTAKKGGTRGATIPISPDRVRNRQKIGFRGGRPPKCDPVDHHEHHAVECGTNRLKCHRAVATGHDKIAVRHEATVLVAVLNE